jgi:hypothetical protein
MRTALPAAPPAPTHWRPVASSAAKAKNPIDSSLDCNTHPVRQQWRRRQDPWRVFHPPPRLIARSLGPKSHRVFSHSRPCSVSAEKMRRLETCSMMMSGRVLRILSTADATLGGSRHAVARAATPQEKRDDGEAHVQARTSLNRNYFEFSRLPRQQNQTD